MAHTSIISAAVIALTFGIGGENLTPVQHEEPLSDGDIVIVANDAAAQTGQTEDNAQDSAKMGKQSGTQTGQQSTVPVSETKKVDQPPEEHTGNGYQE